MPTPTDDYNAEHAALESELTGTQSSATAAHTSAVATATGALNVVKADVVDALITHEHIADEGFIRATVVADETQTRKLAVGLEVHDRKEADSLEKRDRRIADDQLKTFTGVDYHTSDAGTNFSSRYTGANPAIDLNAPVVNGNSLELAVGRLWQQLKNFQIDTTRFVNSKFPTKSFPLISLSGVAVEDTPASGIFDTQYGVLVGGVPGTPGGSVPELTVVGGSIDPGAFNSSYQGWSGNNLASKRLVRIYQAIGNTVESNGRISGLLYHLNNDALPGWDARTRANAIAAANQILPDPGGSVNQYFGGEGGGGPYNQFDPVEDRRGNITVGDQQFSWETKFEQGEGQVAVGVFLRGPLGGSVSPGAPGTPGQSAHTNWFTTTQLGTIPVNCGIFAPDNYYYRGVNATSDAFDAGRVAFVGNNAFLISVSGVVDTYLTVWYRVIDSIPSVAGSSTATSPWRPAAAVGGAIDAAIQAGLAEYAGTTNHLYISNTSMATINVGATNYVQFGVNAISASRGERPPPTLTADLTGHIYGGAVNILGLNVPTIQAPIAYGS